MNDKHLRYISSSIILHLLLILAVGFASYSNTFSVPFQFDDVGYIFQNPVIMNLDFILNPSWAKGNPIYTPLDLRYIPFLTFALNYRIAGHSLFGYHAVNLSIHLISAILVYFLVATLFKTPSLETSSLKPSRRLIALFSALLFAAHPVQTQAVTYICQRFTSLSALFYIGSAVSYIGFRLHFDKSNVKGTILYILSFLLAVFAMKSKENSFSLPFAILSIEAIFFHSAGESLKKRALILFPLFLTMLIIPYSIMDTNQPLSNIFGDVPVVTKMAETLPRLQYFYTEITVLVRYLRLFFLPTGLMLDYDYPTYKSFFEMRVLFSSIILAGLAFAGFWLLRKSGKTDSGLRIVSFGIFWFFITLSVESSFIPLEDFIFEHRMYLPSMAFFPAIAVTVFLTADRFVSRKYTVLIFLASIVVLSVMTYSRNIVWGSEITLWKDNAVKAPRKARVLNNLGSKYADKDMKEKARRYFERAIELKPDYETARSNLGYYYLSIADLDKAESELLKASETPEVSARTLLGLCKIYTDKKQAGKAVEYCRKSIDIDPEYAGAYRLLGIAYQLLNKNDYAIEQFEMAVSLDPRDSLALHNLGHEYLKKGVAEKSVFFYRKALEVSPNPFQTNVEIARAFLKLGDADSAIYHLEKAIALNPNSAEAHQLISEAYAMKGLKERNIRK